MLVNNQYSVRWHNLEKLWNALVCGGRATRQTLADQTGLSLMTVGNLVTQLDYFKILRLSTECAVPPCGGDRARIPAPTGCGAEPRIIRSRALGRRAQFIEIDQRSLWLTLDLTGKQFRLALIGLDGSVLAPGWTHQYNESLSYAENLMNFLAFARSAAHLQHNEFNVLGAAVITPGPYNVTTDTASNCRIVDLNAVRIKETVGKFFFNNAGFCPTAPNEAGRRSALCPIMFVEEDVKLSIRAYLPQAGYEKDDLLVYIYIGEGVGGAVAYQGEVLRGRNAVACDIGQVLDYNEVMFEDKLSLRALVTRLMGETNPNWSEEALFRAALDYSREESGAFRECFIEQANALALMLYNVIWMIDPTRIVIECRYAHTLPFAEEFQRVAREGLLRRLEGSFLIAPEIVFENSERPSAQLGAVQALGRLWIDRVYESAHKQQQAKS
jgi:predicted NBD/HSP70 family sugar kinase